MKNLLVVLLVISYTVMPMCGNNAGKNSRQNAATEAGQSGGQAIIDSGHDSGREEVVIDGTEHSAVGSAKHSPVGNASQESGHGAQMAMEKTKFDMGVFELKGKPRTIEVPFTNTGDAPLVILRTELSCTCLSAEYPRKPVPAGQSGVIKITYTPKKDAGKFQNTVKVITNAEIKSYTLFVDCEVVKK